MRTCVALAAVALFAAPAFGQPSLSATIGTSASSITAPGAGSEGALQASADVEHRFLSSRARVFYELVTSDYAAAGDWRSLANRGGFTYRFGAGPDRSVYAGVDAGFRRNGEAWSEAAFHAVGAFANMEWHAAPATIRAGYRADLRWFPSLAPLDQSQHGVFGSMLLNLATRTTIIAEATAGTKRYAEVPASTEFSVTPAGTLQGQGRGWRMVGGGTAATLDPIIVAGSQRATAQQVTIFARAAQSLADRTAVSFEISRRRVFGEVSPALVLTPPQFMDDGVYDDLFASNANVGALSLKSILGPGVELVASAETRRKQYPGTPAFAEDGSTVEGVLRSDRVFRARVDTTWPLVPSRTGPIALDLLAGYEFTRSDSTSALYRYRGHTVHVGLGIGY